MSETTRIHLLLILQLSDKRQGSISSFCILFPLCICFYSNYVFLYLILALFLTGCRLSSPWSLKTSLFYFFFNFVFYSLSISRSSYQCILMYLFFFVFAFVLQNLHNFLFNSWAPKYRCSSNFGLTNSVQNCCCSCCWKIAMLVLHDMSINAIQYSICLLMTVLHCWIIFNFSSIISSLVNHRTFVFISSHSIDFHPSFLLSISNHILIISSKLDSCVLT